jgi:hypothetical protein
MKNSEILNGHDSHWKTPSYSLTGREGKFDRQALKLTLISNLNDMCHFLEKVWEQAGATTYWPPCTWSLWLTVFYFPFCSVVIEIFSQLCKCQIFWGGHNYVHRRIYMHDSRENSSMRLLNYYICKGISSNVLFGTEMPLHRRINSIWRSVVTIGAAPHFEDCIVLNRKKFSSGCTFWHSVREICRLYR